MLNDKAFKLLVGNKLKLLKWWLVYILITIGILHLSI